MASSTLNIPSKHQIKAVMTLYGKPDSGKTATLRYLYYLLLGGNLSTFNNTVNGFKDFRAVVPFDGIYIYLSTVGDAIVDVDDNWDFFFNRFKKKRRPCINYPNNATKGKIIAVCPARVDDKSSKRHDSYIANLKPSLKEYGYFHKNNYHLSSLGLPTQQDVNVLGDSNLTLQMQQDAIYMAHVLYDQIMETMKRI